jgi:chorismate mutase-like protein
VPERLETMEELARRVRAALESADLTAFRELLGPAVTWGPPGQQPLSCQTRDQVLAWYQRGRDAGVRARVTEVEVRGSRILVGLRVTGEPGADGTGAGEPGEDGAGRDRWQVLTARDGRVTEITGFGDRAEAAAAAGFPREVRTTGRLESLRAEIDAIDRQLLGLLLARVHCCQRVASHKREEGIAMMQPHRIDVVRDRAAAFAAEHPEIDPAYLRRLFDLVVTETCRIEDTIIMNGGPPPAGGR